MHFNFMSDGSLKIRPEVPSDCMLLKYFVNELKTHGLRMIDIEVELDDEHGKPDKGGHSIKMYKTE